MDIADEKYISKDKESITKEFEKRLTEENKDNLGKKVEESDSNNIEKQIEDVKSIKDLITLEDNIRKDPDVALKLDTPEKINKFEELLKKKREELIKSVTFDDIKKGTYLIMKDQKRYPDGVGIVTKKTKKDIIVAAIDEQNSSYKINKEDLGKHIQNIYSKELSETSPETIISKETEVVAKENIDNMEKAKGEEASIADIEKVDQKQIDDEFDKNLGCK